MTGDDLVILYGAAVMASIILVIVAALGGPK